MSPAVISAFKVFLPAVVSFIIGIALTPFWSDLLYKHRMWKKKVRNKTIDGKEAVVFASLHAEKEIGTPRMGGVIIWASALLTVALMVMVSWLGDGIVIDRLTFLSRNQTWLPAFSLLVGATIGLIDDYFEASQKASYFAGGLSLGKRLLAVILLGLACGWWFYFQLDFHSVAIPFDGVLPLGIFFIPFFILVMIAIYSGGIIDGIDGLSGGVFASIFSAYGIIALAQNQVDLAAFCFVIVGGILAFLWFNIPPARFYMSETGSMALTVTLTVIAFLTNHVILLFVIAFPLIATSLSNIIQLVYKRIFGRKLFHIAPIHHHFEAIGWPAYKVTMRYWIISIFCAILGTVLALVA